MNDLPDDEETRLLRAALARQRQILESKKNDMVALERKIRENLRQQDEVYLRLFPPVRPDRNAAFISSLIEEKSAELAHLQSAIKAQKAKLDSDSGISLDDEGLIQLKSRQTTTFANLEHLRSLLSPIRVLPVELLAQIFMLSYDPVGSASLSNAALVVTHICASWRNIAVNKPELWSSLKLGPNNFTTRPHGIIPLARLWLERSGTRPLSLYVRPDRPMDHPDPTPTNLLLQLVRLYTPYLARWKSIFFDYTRFDIEHKLLAELPQPPSLPHLEKFGITANSIQYPDWIGFSTLLGRAPRLRCLTWITKSVYHDPPFLYDQLTRLEVGGSYSMKKASELLSHAKLLRVIDFTVFIRSRSYPTDFPHVVHKSLQRLALICVGNSSVFFDILTLPALQELHITKTYSWESAAPSIWSQGSFLHFLFRSKCYLTNLGIVDYDITSDEVLALLRHLSSSLVNFEIENFQVKFITDEVLNALTYPAEDLLATISPDGEDSPTILCPLLRELRMVGCLSSTDGVLAEMVASRCCPPPGLARLETAMFGLDSSKSPQDNARILALNRKQVDYMILDEHL